MGGEMLITSHNLHRPQRREKKGEKEKEKKKQWVLSKVEGNTVTQLPSTHISFKSRDTHTPETSQSCLPSRKETSKMFSFIHGASLALGLKSHTVRMAILQRVAGYNKNNDNPMMMK